MQPNIFVSQNMVATLYRSNILPATVMWFSTIDVNFYWGWF